MADFDQNAVPGNAAEAEALIDSFQSPEREEAAVETKAAPTEYSIPYKGKEEKYPIEKILEFANQGRDYNQKMRDYNAQKTQWETQSTAQKAKWAELETKLGRYSEVEEYIKKDPTWWDHVQKSYQERTLGQAPGANASPDPRFQKLEETVGKLVSTFEEREQAQLAQKEDQTLDLKVSEYRDKYKQFDWTTVDANGLDLEKRILDHAVKMGLNRADQFTVAANDYLHEEHLKRASESAKEGVGKHLERVTKLGLGPITDKPTMQLKRANNVSSKSWDELSQEAQAAAGL